MKQCASIFATAVLIAAVSTQSIIAQDNAGIGNAIGAAPRFWVSAASVRGDFWEMFRPGAQWDTLRARMDVFSIHVNALTARTDTALIRSATSSLKSAGVMIAFECGGLRPFSGCDSLAGERHAQLELGAIARWSSRGGSVDCISMDSPINTMILGGDPSGTCDWTVSRAAHEMVDYMKAVRAVYPSVTFGLVEPVPWYSVGTFPSHPGNNYGDLLLTLDTVLAVVAQRGEQLAIFHSDSPYEYSDNPQTQGWKKLVALEQWLHAHGIRHGRINNSQEGGFTSDSLFWLRTLASHTKFIAEGGAPDEVEIWCWYAHPAVNEPETQPYTFTYTANALFDVAYGAGTSSVALFEPPNGRVYHGVGQAQTGVSEYMTAMGDSAILPAVYNFYHDIPGTRGPKFAELRQMLAAEKQSGRIPHLSIAMTDGRVWTDSIIANTNQYDAIIDSMALICRDFGQRMFVRPGFEFNGSWFPYHAYQYPRAFRKIFDRFRTLGADSTAFLWCYYTAAPADFDSVDASGARWYPGDDYVDWFSLDLFNSRDFHPDSANSKRGQLTNKGKSEKFLAMARAKNKPVFLSEVSAAGTNITTDPVDGLVDWNAWFEPFFRFLAGHPEVKGYNYTNWDWSQYGQWKEWGDSRIEINPVILNKYRTEMRTARYIHLPYSGQSNPQLPAQVRLADPADSASMPAGSVTLSWHPATPDVDRYQLQVAGDRRFNPPVLNDSTRLDTTAVFSPSGAGTWYWRVRAHNPVGWGPYSDIRSFSQKDTGVVIPFAGVEIDTTVQYQTMEGWGASSNFYEENLVRFNATVRAELFDKVYSELGANIMCIRLYSGFQTSKGGPYNWGIMSAQRMILNEALSRGKINTLWLKVSSPPGWMKDNGSERNGGHVKHEHYQDYADYLSYYIRHMRSDYGVRINAVSMFNEPGFAPAYESTSTTPEEYRDILKVVAATFRRDTLDDVELIGPEAGKITEGWSYYNAILNDPDAAAALSRITTHQYGDQRLLYGTGPADDWNGLRDLAALHGKRVWETEIFVGGPGMATRDIDEALRASLLVWTAITTGNVTAWHYWQFHHPAEDGASQGIISLNADNASIGVFPRYYALMQWMKHIPSGSVRVKTDCDNPDLYTASFIHGGNLIAVVFNRTATDISTGFRFPQTAGGARHYRTSATENHADAPEPMPGDVTTFLTVNARSISTLVMPLLTTGVETVDHVEIGFDVYPNPASTHSELRLAPGPGSASISITDALGRIVVRRVVDDHANGYSMTLDLSRFAAGSYRITVSTGKRISTRVFLRL